MTPRDPRQAHARLDEVKKLRELPELDLGEMLGWQAHELARKGRQLGLKMVVR